jgi:hypothetical protein
MNEFETKPRLKTRKYLAEGGLNLYSSGANVLRPSDLYTHGQDALVKAALEGCNIYLVVKRKKISICPHSLKTRDGRLFGDFLVHDNFEFERFPFHQADHSYGALDVKTENQYGHNILVRVDEQNTVKVPSYQLTRSTVHSLKNKTDLEVLYIGQGIGRKNTRLAVDRLVSHSTLQRILADTQDTEPDSEILLLMYRYEHHRNIISTAGDFSITPQATDEEESKHFDAIQDARLDRFSRVSLAEAALINYFKPHYNVHYKEKFRTGKLKVLNGILKLDLSALVVEINTANIGCRLYTKTQSPPSLSKLFDAEQLERLRQMSELEDEAAEYLADLRHTHIAEIPLYTADQRETFIHAMPWQT